MKKILLLPVLAFAAFAFAAPAFAATLTVSPQTITVTKGQTVTLTLSVDPEGAKIAAVKGVLSYPQGLLTPASFTFAPTWLAVTQSGYDQMSGGTIIKSAGYPSGISNPTVFGTLVFTAMASGTATVAVQNTSELYNSAAVNSLSGAQGSAAITITEAANTPPSNGSTGSVSGSQPAANATNTPTQAGTTGNKPITKTNASAQAVGSPAVSQTAAASANTQTATSATSSGATVASSQALAAVAAATVSSSFSHSPWLWIIVALIILFILTTWLRRSRAKKNAPPSMLK